MLQLVVFVRLLHILAAVSWVGMSLTIGIFIANAEKLSGLNAFIFTRNLYTKTPISAAFPIVAVLTTLCGILLYLPAINQPSGHFTQTGQIVLGIGALAGIAAAGHGIGLGQTTTKYVKTLDQHLTSVQDDVTKLGSDAITTLTGMHEKIMRSERVSLILSAVALIAMGSARYL